VARVDIPVGVETEVAENGDAGPSDVAQEFEQRFGM
jgi:hypothetical protein